MYLPLVQKLVFAVFKALGLDRSTADGEVYSVVAIPSSVPVELKWRNFIKKAVILRANLT